jgi:hypothetical protein
LRQSARVTIGSLLVLSLLTGFFSLLLAASGYGEELYQSYFASPLLILLNLLPPALLIFAVYFATGRAWLGFAVGAGIVLLASGVDFYKIQIRGDPLMAVDLSVAAEAGKMIGRYSPDIGPPFTNAAIFGLFGTLWTFFVCRYRFSGARRRVFASLLTAAVLLGLSATVYVNDKIYRDTVGDYDIGWPTHNEDFRLRGFVYPFIHSIKAAFPSPPDGYSAAAAEQILAKYPTDAIPENARVNVISVMLEAFSDLSEFPGVSLTADVYAKWHALEAESVRGRLVDNIFAGGTIDTERLFLTGNTALTDIRGATESYVYYFRDNGYYAEGFHPGDDWYYNRTNVCRDLGFERYFFFSDFKNADKSDKFFFDKLRSLYDRRDKSVPYFNHSLTIQNHGGYDATKTAEPHLISREGISDEAFNIANNYLLGIYDTNQRIWDFVDTFRDDAEPVILLFYGDHKPWLGNAESVYRELGINTDTAEDDGFYSLYTTPYIIWANDAAKSVLGDDFTGVGGDFSPTFLMNKLFALAGWGGDAYMKAANAAFEETPVVNSRTETTDALRELKIAEYYRRKHFQHNEMIGDNG